MTDNEIIKAWDILAKFDFFGGQRAGRELWNDKPFDVQNEDIENFSKDVAFLKDLINRLQAENERLLPFGVQVEVSKKIEKEIKAEAYKEFAELSIKKICERVTAPTPIESYIVERCNQEIDNTYKELIGE